MSRYQSFLTSIIGLVLAAGIAWECIERDLHALVVASIALSVAYTCKDGADRIANAIRAARQVRDGR